MEEYYRPIPCVEVDRGTAQRWSRLKEMLQDYLSSQTYQRALSVGMLNELLPTPECMGQLNQEQSGLLHEEIAGCLRTLCRINRVVQVLDMVCEAAYWEKSGQTTDVPLNNNFSMELVFYSLVGEPNKIDLKEAVHEVFPGFKEETEKTVAQGLQEGTDCLLGMFEGPTPLVAYRRDLVENKLREGGTNVLYLPTRFEQVFLRADYSDASQQYPLLGFEIRKIA